MEVLAVVAYNQPVTKSFIEQVRGVESGQVVNNLVEKGLVEEAGRLNVPGRPLKMCIRDSPGILHTVKEPLKSDRKDAVFALLMLLCGCLLYTSSYSVRQGVKSPNTRASRHLASLRRATIFL